MKVILLITIVLLSIWAAYNFIHPTLLLTLYAFIVIAPLLVIFIKKNLFNGLLLWFVLVLFKEFGRIRIPLLPDFPPERIVWLLLFLLFFTEVAFKQRRLVQGGLKIEIAMVLLCVYILFSMIVTGTIYKEGHGLFISTFLSSYAIPFSIFFFAKNIVDDEHKIKKIFVFFTIISFYLGLTGIFEHFELKSLVFPKYIMIPYAGVHFGRARGPFLNASVNGTVLGIIFFMTFYLLFQRYKKWVKFLFVTSIILMVLTIFFTLTRACWLSFLISLFIIPVFFPQLRKIFIAVFVIMMVVFISVSTQLDFNLQLTTNPEREYLFGKHTFTEKITGRFSAVNPIYARINLYGAVWQMFLEKPIFGFGFNTFGEVSPKYFHTIKGIPYEIVNVPHDTWSGILAELGLVGLGLIFFIIFYILLVSIRSYRCLPREGFSGKGLVAVFWGATVVYLINIEFIQMRFFLFVNSLFFLMSGIIVGLYQRHLLSSDKT